ncbi:unnamed protein product [Didymodactylos carnosus]|uniref:Uncharacterized protein n=1 Tax=Didymodactylos carnosus TaxID=1234261 RepID=A0A814EW58_9BILA|nr:unnamed protein product [Didymodactylos carnosus]CAF0977647.1 unnamed protein product [Didymodactylos carnosus]CAF3652497.1 unnamed protein product [Didymodactylos carnosus]CAF3750467.1 unnamed protein product [Didymodactylos carnosus]
MFDPKDYLSYIQKKEFVMGANNAKRLQSEKNTNLIGHVVQTPPKQPNRLVQLQTDPRSPTDGVSRTPIQININEHITKIANAIHRVEGPSIMINDNLSPIRAQQQQENKNNDGVRYRKYDGENNSLNLPTSKNQVRTSGVTPVLDPENVLLSIENSELPPYQL